jgi:hypothetical protein
VVGRLVRIINWKGLERKGRGTVTVSQQSLEETEENLRIAAVLIEIRTYHLPNTSLKLYNYKNLLGGAELVKAQKLCEISRSSGNNHEHYSILGCDAVWFGKYFSSVSKKYSDSIFKVDHGESRCL